MKCPKNFIVVVFGTVLASTALTVLLFFLVCIARAWKW